jgi:hypothetical protein
MRRTATAALLIALCTAAAVPAGASASLKDKRFIANVTASQTITWNQPRVFGTRTCFGTSWTEGNGKETLTFKSRPTPIVAYRSNKYVYFEYQTKTRGSYSDGIPGFGRLDRSGEYRNGEDPGDCGGGEPTKSQGPYDCGAHDGMYEASLSDNGKGDLALSLKDAYLHKNYSYKDCPIVEPKNWSGGGLRTITAPFNGRKVLKTKKPITIRNKWSGFDETVLADGGLASAETTYKLTLKPLN